MSRSTDTLLAFLLGAVSGSITALLCAPDKGSVTRERLRNGVAELSDKGEAMVEEAMEPVKRKANEVGNIVRRQADSVREAAHEAQEAYRKEVSKGS